MFRRKYIASGFAYDGNIFCCYFVFMSIPCNIIRTKRLYDQYLHVCQMQECRNNAIDIAGRKNVLQNSSNVYLKEYISSVKKLCCTKNINLTIEFVQESFH